ncbi:MAG: hypothetical protein JNG90_18350 [Planctomycetaceae bacterium]|nr:hypothetical protein [Planctomycetaceae bacterium]
MPPQLDVYRDWLKIEDKQRPLNHYQLLRVKKFEDDPVRIRSNYRQLNAHVRKFAAGDFAQQSQDLLNELARAMLVLTDAKRKGEYDASLGRVETKTRQLRTIEELLLARKVLDAEKLEKARSFAQAVGLDMQDAVLQQKLASPEITMQIYAESLGLPYVDLAETGVGVEHVPLVPATIARQHACVPVMVDDDVLIMASPHPLKPDVEDDLRLRVGMPIRAAICTPSGINAALDRFFTKEAAAAEKAANPGRAVQAAQPAAGAAAKKDDKKAAKQPAAESSLTPAEAKKQRMMVSLMAGNFTFMAVMFYLQLFSKVPQGLFKSLGIAAIAGGAIFGLVFGVMSLRK